MPQEERERAREARAAASAGRSRFRPRSRRAAAAAPRARATPGEPVLTACAISPATRPSTLETMSEAVPTPSAISLRGVVKTFGPITAVDGLDLDVPAGICLGLLGPNGAGKSTTMRLLTGQAIADSGELRVLDFELPRQAKAARAVMGVVPQLDNLDVDVTVEDNLAVFARLYRVADVAAAVDRALDLARLRTAAATPSTSSPAACAGGCCSPAGSSTSRGWSCSTSRPSASTRRSAPQMWSLIDGLRTRGATILMSTHYIEEAERLADEVAVMAHGKIVARGRPAELIAKHAGRETAEVYGPPDRLAEVARLAESEGLRVGPPARRSRSSAPSARPTAASPTTRPPRRLARGRLRPAHRRGGRVSSPGEVRIRRLEPAAIAAVMSRELANFRTFWKATTFSSVLEPIIYLLAFGLGLGATIVSRVDGLDYVEFVGTGMVATAVIFSSALPAMFGTFVKHRFQRTYDAILAAPDRRRGAGHRRDAVDRLRAGFYGCFPLMVSFFFGLDPTSGCCWCRCSASSPRSASPPSGSRSPASVAKIDQFNYVTTLVITPLFLVAGTFFPIDQLPEGFQVAANFNPLYQLVELVRAAAFGFEAVDVLRFWRSSPSRSPSGGSRSAAWSAADRLSNEARIRKR